MSKILKAAIRVQRQVKVLKEGLRGGATHIVFQREKKHV